MESSVSRKLKNGQSRVQKWLLNCSTKTMDRIIWEDGFFDFELPFISRLAAQLKIVQQKDFPHEIFLWA